MPFVVREHNPTWVDPESTLVMDSKGLYDSLDNELQPDDKKSALEVPIILVSMKRICGRARWVHHNKNPAGAMTKFKGAHMEPLLGLLRSGMYAMCGEREELESRAQQKKTGTVRQTKRVLSDSTSKCQHLQRLHVVPEPTGS